ncbi:MAG TPA: hypothetical protein VNO21_07835 [Polyangiaceae bacterium]|nr:hypothetical protein [Polyangiaceae bacterium]
MGAWSAALCPDACRLYFVSGGNPADAGALGGYDIYLAMRTP